MGKHFNEDQINVRARNNYTVDVINALQKQIEMQRMELNKLAAIYGLNSAEVLKKSTELDQLLNTYHHTTFRYNVDK